MPIFSQALAEGKYNEEDLLNEDLRVDTTILPVPIALKQDPAPVNLDMPVTHSHNKARSTIEQSISTDYALKKSLAMKKRRSTSEVKNCFSALTKKDERLEIISSCI